MDNVKRPSFTEIALIGAFLDLQEGDMASLSANSAGYMVDVRPGTFRAPAFAPEWEFIGFGTYRHIRRGFTLTVREVA